MTDAPFSFVVLAADIPARGRHFRLEVEEDALRRIADALGVLEVASLTAELDVRPGAGETVAVRGSLEAEVAQTDVVTLDPMRQSVAERIELMLSPAEPPPRARGGKGAAAPAAETVDADLYRDGRINLGTIVVEHLALGLDPYPRSADVTFPGHIEDDPAADPSPFAVLAKIRRDGR